MNSSIGMKTVSVFILVLGSLVIGSCDNFMSGGDSFKEQIKQEVAEANAPTVTITVRAENDSMGTTSPLGSTNVKVGVPINITTTVNSEFGFVNWIQEGGNPGDIVFADATRVETTATVNRNVSGLGIRAMFDSRPSVDAFAPFNNEQEVIRTRPIRITFSKPIDLATATPANITIQQRPRNSLDPFETINSLFQDPVLNGSVLTFNLQPGNRYGAEDLPYEVLVTVRTAVADINGYNMNTSVNSIFYTALGAGDTEAPVISDLRIRSAADISLDPITATASPTVYLRFNAVDNVSQNFIAVVEDITDSGAGSPGVSLYNNPYISLNFIQIHLPDSDRQSTLSVHVFDESLNKSNVLTTDIILDRVAPTVSDFLLDSGAPYTNQNSVAISFDDQDASTGVVAWNVSETLAINEADWVLVAPTTYSFANGTNELKTVYIHVRDGAGNVSERAEASIVFDNRAPELTVTSSHPNGFVNEGTEVTVTAAFDENIDGTPLIEITGVGVSGVPSTAMSASGDDWVYEWTVPNGDGTVSVSITASDLAGNAAAVTAGSITDYTVDNQAPELAVTSSHPSAIVKQGTEVTVTAAFNEEIDGTPVIEIIGTGVAGVASTSMTASGENWTYSWVVPSGDGTAEVNITAADLAGNPAQVVGGSITEYTVDNTAPIATGAPVKTPGPGGYINAADLGNSVVFTVSVAAAAAVGDVIELLCDGLSFTPEQTREVQGRHSGRRGRVG